MISAAIYKTSKMPYQCYLKILSSGTAVSGSFEVSKILQGRLQGDEVASYDDLMVLCLFNTNQRRHMRMHVRFWNYLHSKHSETIHITVKLAWASQKMLMHEQLIRAACGGTEMSETAKFAGVFDKFLMP